MTDSQIPDFTETELWVVRSAVNERFGKEIALELADVELRLSPEDRVLTSCPAVYWSERGAHFVISKVGEKAYRCQFYYRGFEQYGTGRQEYDDLGHCVVTLLQVQSDHERQRAGK
jgi:hypothetical protein